MLITVLEISAGPATLHSRTVRCKVTARCLQRLGCRCQWNGATRRWHPNSGRQIAWHLSPLCRSVTTSLRRWVPTRLPAVRSSGAASGCSRHIRNGFTASGIHLPAADVGIARTL